jgi:hypothetical protein
MSLEMRMIVMVGVMAMLPAACGSVTLDRASASASATGTGGAGAGTGTSSGSSTGGDVGGSIGFGGFPDTTGGTGGAGGTPSLPGHFDCGGCACDGATHYCELQVGLKKLPPPGPPPEPLCLEPDGMSPNSCKPIPAACLPEATCACVYPNLGVCSCKVDPQGITVLCNLP